MEIIAESNALLTFTNRRRDLLPPPPLPSKIGPWRSRDKRQGGCYAPPREVLVLFWFSSEATAN